MWCDIILLYIESWHDNRNQIESWHQGRFTPLAFLCCYSGILVCCWIVTRVLRYLQSHVNGVKCLYASVCIQFVSLWELSFVSQCSSVWELLKSAPIVLKFSTFQVVSTSKIPEPLSVLTARISLKSRRCQKSSSAPLFEVFHCLIEYSDRQVCLGLRSCLWSELIRQIPSRISTYSSLTRLVTYGNLRPQVRGGPWVFMIRDRWDLGWKKPRRSITARGTQGSDHSCFSA